MMHADERGKKTAGIDDFSPICVYQRPSLLNALIFVCAAEYQTLSIFIIVSKAGLLLHLSKAP
jgi:hypothetical protein